MTWRCLTRASAFAAWSALLLTGSSGCSSSSEPLFSASSVAGGVAVAGSGSSGGAAAAGDGNTTAGHAPGADASGGAPAVPSSALGGNSGSEPGGAAAEVGVAGASPIDDKGCEPGCCATSDGSDVDLVNVVADSVRGFSATQGHCGWSFGYLPEGSAPFNLLPIYSSTPDPSVWPSPVWLASPSQPPWLMISDTGQHPNQEPLMWSDRRWVSSKAGTITIRGRVAKSDTGVTGDGIGASIQIAGKEAWRTRLATDDAVGQDFSLDAEVEVGSTVDFIVDPLASDAHDTTAFTAVILLQRASQSVP